MWFITGGGLNRYDCNTFVVYQNNADDPTTLSANDRQSLIEEDHRNLWIGTWGADTLLQSLQGLLLRFHSEFTLLMVTVASGC